jgi:hypothetical protein
LSSQKTFLSFKIQNSHIVVGKSHVFKLVIPVETVPGIGGGRVKKKGG